MNPAIADQPFLFKPPATGAAAENVSRDPSTDSIGETHREITDIVREIASVSHSEISAEQYFAKLTDGILRAMAAAKGVVIWTRCVESEFSPMARIGAVTDTSIDEKATPTHRCLLEEVFQAGAPVIVPPTPGANLPDVPANPTEFPAALVPIDVGTSGTDGQATTGTLIEVFFANDESTVAQRGYLRFVAQMADLAGEFLRTRRLRQLSEEQRWTNRLDQWIDELNGLSNPNSIGERITDLMVEGFGFDRAAYLRPSTHGRRSFQVAAVSHVDQVDAKSDAVKWLIQQTHQHTTSNHVDQAGPEPRWMDTRGDDSAGGTGNNGGIADKVSIGGNNRDQAGSHLRVVGVLPLPLPTKTRSDVVVLLRSGVGQSDPMLRRQVERFLSAASLVLHNAVLRSSMSVRRPLARSGIDAASTSPWRRWLLRSAVAAIVLMMACLPVSMTVTADATFRPKHVQRVCAPRHAIVQSVFVQHGDHVKAGQPLVQLDDTDLNEQLAALHGRRSVLLEKRSVWTETLVDPNRRGGRGDPASIREDAETQRQLTEAELRGVNDEIALLETTKASLQIVADRDGCVDAWKIQGDENRRPVRRGEPLLSVVSDQSDWYADALFVQSHVQHLRMTREDVMLEATVCPVASPDVRFDATIDQIGPALANETLPQTNVRLLLHAAHVDSLEPTDTSALREGSPAKVLVKCGRRPLVYVLFQDAIDWMRTTATLYGVNN